MELTTRTLTAQKHIALVAHDHCKKTFCMQQEQQET